MVFGKIEYLNLLPFHVFMKKFAKSSQQSMSMHYHKGVPSQINKKFEHKIVDAAFISSIKAKKYNHINLGIIAKKDVRSVLVIPGIAEVADEASATSNVLAKILGINGEVIIGDRALKHFLLGGNHIDLALEWHKKFGLPFVFALLCFHANRRFYKKMGREFLKKEVKIPQYLLAMASKKSGIAKDEILDYLKLISYKVDKKAKLGVEKFYKEVKTSLQIPAAHNA